MYKIHVPAPEKLVHCKQPPESQQPPRPHSGASLAALYNTRVACFPPLWQFSHERHCDKDKAVNVCRFVAAWPLSIAREESQTAHSFTILLSFAIWIINARVNIAALPPSDVNRKRRLCVLNPKDKTLRRVFASSLDSNDIVIILRRVIYLFLYKIVFFFLEITADACLSLLSRSATCVGNALTRISGHQVEAFYRNEIIHVGTWKVY